jgi:hypothetical protein
MIPKVDTGFRKKIMLHEQGSGDLFRYLTGDNGATGDIAVQAL